MIDYLPQPVRPGRWLYGVAAVLLTAGVAIAAIAGFWFSREVLALSGTLEQVVVPGAADLVLEPGSYTIYHEYQSVVGAKSYSNRPQLQGLLGTVTSKSTGQPIAISAQSVNETYQLGDRRGKAVWVFQIEQAGEYTLAATYPQQPVGPDVVLAVGKGSVGLRIVTMVFILLGGIGALAVFGIAALVVLLITFFKRRAARQRSAAESAGGF